MRRWLLLAGVIAASIAVAAVGTGTARADDAAEAAWKAAHDTDPHIPLTPYEKHMRTEKIKAIADRASKQTGKPVVAQPDAAAGDAVLPDGATTATAPTSDTVLANQVAQTMSYYCGPAAEKEALGQFGISTTQATMASQLGTTTDGTAWSGGSTSTGHPIPDVLNAHSVWIYYIPEAVNGSPSSGEISNYKSFLVEDIYTESGPLVGDAWETPSSTYHLVGHPSDRTIFHWFDIRGYSSSGGNTLYEDSVHGATSVSWYAGVPAYSTLSSTAIVHIVGGRGYVW
jgi:hypothetical protein